MPTLQELIQAAMAAKSTGPKRPTLGQSLAAPRVTEPPDAQKLLREAILGTGQTVLQGLQLAGEALDQRPRGVPREVSTSPARLMNVPFAAMASGASAFADALTGQRTPVSIDPLGNTPQTSFMDVGQRVGGTPGAVAGFMADLAAPGPGELATMSRLGDIAPVMAGIHLITPEPGASRIFNRMDPPAKLELKDAQALAQDVASRAPLNAPVQQWLGGIAELPDIVQQTAERFSRNQPLIELPEGRIVAPPAKYDPVAEVPLERLFSPRQFHASPIAMQMADAEKLFKAEEIPAGNRGALMRHALRTAGVPEDATRFLLDLGESQPLPVIGGVDLDPRVAPKDMVVWDDDLQGFRFPNYVRGRMSAITDAAKQAGTTSDWTDPSAMAQIVGGDPVRTIQLGRLMSAFSPGTASSYNPLQALEIFLRSALAGKKGLPPQTLGTLLQAGNMSSMAPMYPTATTSRVQRALRNDALNSLKVEDLTGTVMNQPTSAALDLWNWGRMMGSLSEATPGDAPYRLVSEAQDRLYRELGVPTNEGFATNWNFTQKTAGTPTLSYNEALRVLPLDTPLFDASGKLNRKVAKEYLARISDFKTLTSKALASKKETGTVPFVWTPDPIASTTQQAILQQLDAQRAASNWSKYTTNPKLRKGAADKIRARWGR
jgi:hypothetical protein